MRKECRTWIAVRGVAILLFIAPSLSQAQNAQHDSQPLPADNDTHKVIDKGTHSATTKVTNIKVKVLLNEPYIMRSQVDPTGYEGMFIDILHDIARRANLSYEISPQADGVYGFESSPRNWSGLIGSLVDKEAQLAVAPLTIMSKRQGVVDFTHPIMSSGLRILYKPPNPVMDTESFIILLSPFSVGMWLVVLLMFIAVSVFFYVIGRFSPYEDHAFVGKAATYEGLTFFNSFLYVYSSMTFQGCMAAPKSLSGRVLAAFWWLFVLLIIAAYTASLCAIFLAFRPSITSVPFDSFEELALQSHVSYGIVKGGMTESYLSSSPRPLQRRLWGTIKAYMDTVTVRSMSEGVHRVRMSNGHYAMIMEGPTAEYLSEQVPCDLMTLGEELSEHNWGFACQKDTDLCSKLNIAILQMKEDDFIFELKKKWLHQGCGRDNPTEYIYQGLAFLDTLGIKPTYYADRSVTLRRFGIGFLCVLGGISLSTCFLFAEIFYAKRRGSSVPVPQRIVQSSDDQARIDTEYKDEDN